MKDVKRIILILERVCDSIEFQRKKVLIAHRFRESFNGLEPEDFTIEEHRCEASLRIDVQPLRIYERFSEIICKIESAIAADTKRGVCIEEIELRISNVCDAGLKIGDFAHFGRSSWILLGKSSDGFYCFIIFYYE